MADHTNPRSEGKKQRAKNEETFRRANVTLKPVAERLYDETDAHIFLCECSSTECQSRLPIIIQEFDEVAKYPTRFAVIKGHEQRDIESVVEEHPGWAVVEKHPDLV